MKRLSKLLIVAVAMSCFNTVTVSAHDFEVKAKSGNTLFFNIIDAKNNRAELTYDGSIDNTAARHYIGQLNVPQEVKHDGKTYSITAIGGMAFRNCAQLESVRMHANIKRIGAFAFEGCSKLKTVILPVGQTDIERGAFFRCEAIDSVAYGGEWSQIDLSHFRWSLKLKSLRLPAGMEKLTNLKQLPYLEKVYVTADNINFTTAEGALYNKNGKLLACPKAFKGKLAVIEGTREIVRGALADCRYLTELDLPSTLERMSFRELSFLTQLSTITVRSEKPFMTGVNDAGTPCFILKAASAKIKMQVAKVGKKAWKEAVQDQYPGNYSELDAANDDVRYMIKDTELISDKQLEFIKTSND